METKDISTIIAEVKELLRLSEKKSIELAEASLRLELMKDKIPN
jgi:hypothetical protein